MPTVDLPDVVFWIYGFMVMIRLADVTRIAKGFYPTHLHARMTRVSLVLGFSSTALLYGFAFELDSPRRSVHTNQTYKIEQRHCQHVQMTL